MEGRINLPDTKAKMQSFKVSGMSCGHCVRTATDAIRDVDAAAQVEMDLEAGRVTVRDGIPPERYHYFAPHGADVGSAPSASDR